MSREYVNQTADKVLHKASRLLALDALRGLIVVFMALDHANHFVAHKHPPSEIWDGVFPVYYDSLAFLTRLVTHLAAPGFFFLMGAGMLLFAHARQERGWSRWAIIRHFLIRGGVLIALQLLVVNRAWELSPEGWGVDIYIGVLCALGGTMILGSLLLWLKPVCLLVLAFGLLIGTELIHPDPGMWNTVSHEPLNVIFLYPGGDSDLWAYYSVLPWLELVTFGLAFGYWLVENPRRAFRRAWMLGGLFLVTFVVVRYLDGFGNIRPRMSDNWIDFLNVVKYPPSITFTLTTTGVNLILLGLFAWVSERWGRTLHLLVTFGRTPLFFYLAHLFLFAGLGRWLTPDGTAIVRMYPVWLLGLAVLYPLCLWYGRFKHCQPANSVLRFL